jgi:hypothetical protein
VCSYLSIRAISDLSKSGTLFTSDRNQSTWQTNASGVRDRRLDLLSIAANASGHPVTDLQYPDQPTEVQPECQQQPVTHQAIRNTTGTSTTGL